MYRSLYVNIVRKEESFLIVPRDNRTLGTFANTYILYLIHLKHFFELIQIFALVDPTLMGKLNK